MNRKKFFTSYDIKNTKQRNIIYEIFENTSQPLTAEDIYFQYLNHDESISLSTIYRILDLFTNKGILLKTHIQEDQKACFIINKHEHKHFLICTDCKTMVEIDGCPFEDYEKRIENETNFRISGHKLELFGQCGKCK